ncbi:four helix bundle protein [Tenacibaculum caenipelagi]|uniref:Four helix bundle protein n=1 Tax=Tenacibaculum caenipelagi TaxID=1325435 RepID=A0A4R6TAB3_9FLAO|nr:four helix bundle protein [Tenacibaculum caenipelagi]TDQ23826.1 four helix bundle protein [Tenacibaculum caenipelagi]
MKEKTSIKTFRDLLVWQKSMVFVTEVYKISNDFPKEEVFGLTSQIRRCAVSIPSNISEGYGRQSLGDFIRFLNIGIASLFELQTQLEISLNLEYISNESFTKLYEQSREIERMLYKSHKKVKRKTMNISLCL